VPAAEKYNGDDCETVIIRPDETKTTNIEPVETFKHLLFKSVKHKPSYNIIRTFYVQKRDFFHSRPRATNNWPKS